MKKLIAFIIGIFSVCSSYSQNESGYPSSQSDVGNAIRLYDHFTADNAPLYNGKEYVFYAFRMKGTPYFADERFFKGWINYQGKKYDSVSLLYDLSRNELAVLSADNKSAIVLHNEMVDSFYISENKFVNLAEDTAEHLVHAGYYNILYDGKTQLLAKRSKTISDAIEDNFIIRVFSSKDQIYIRKDGHYYPVSNSKDVLEVFSDKKKELRKKMRQNHVKIKRITFENSLVKTVALYDELPQ